MNIKASRDHFETRMKWQINEATFQVIEEETCTWIAEVTTTHLEQNGTFFLLVQGFTYFSIEERWRHKLGAWFGRYL